MKKPTQELPILREQEKQRLPLIGLFVAERPVDADEQLNPSRLHQTQRLAAQSPSKPLEVIDFD